MDKDQESLIQQDFEDTFRYIYHEYTKDCDGEYFINEVQSLWLGWKAAHSKYHKDIVVEIPYSWEAYEAGCTVVDLELLLEALNKVGVKYK
jgi:hypothetical protein